MREWKIIIIKTGNFRLINKIVNKVLKIAARNLFLLSLFCVNVVLFANDSAAKPSSTDVPKISIDKFGKLIVLESGRKKPLDTYARNKLMQFSGKQNVGGLNALQWLAGVVFNPDAADNDLIFIINNPEVADALGISPRAKRRYCFAELNGAAMHLEELSHQAMNMDPMEWTTFQKEVIQTLRNLKEYASLRSALSFNEPQNHLFITDSSIANLLGIPLFTPISYYDFLTRTPAIVSAVKEIQNKNIDSLTEGDQALVRFTGKMYQMEKTFDNPPPHLIPNASDAQHWLSPWGAVQHYRTAVIKYEPVNLLLKMKQAYNKSDQVMFDAAVEQFVEQIKQSNSNKVHLPNPELELFYNKINPFLFSKIIYGIAALLAIFSLSLNFPKVHKASLLLIVSGLFLHTTGVICRMIIMAHPPVTNLYETFVFTAWATVVIGIVLESMKYRSIGVLTAAVTGFLFLHIAGKYARDGDTLGMLSAVLDSSFWLTTHIVTIALGYAGYVGAGLVGHIYLVSKVMKKNNEQLILIDRAVYGIFVFGFIFTTIGTIFGGMWADQAWGRFWGWDPKENGALLLILWGLIVLHARLGGIIKDTGMAVGAIIGVILVMVAWIGVNLLGIGLHSYGFTSSGALALFIYFGIEAAFLFGCGVVLLINSGYNFSRRA